MAEQGGTTWTVLLKHLVVCQNSVLDVLQMEIEDLEERLEAVGEDAQLANVDLQGLIQRQQQTLQMMSQISKALHDTAMSIIRKMAG